MDRRCAHTTGGLALQATVVVLLCGLLGWALPGGTPELGSTRLSVASAPSAAPAAAGGIRASDEVERRPVHTALRRVRTRTRSDLAVEAARPGPLLPALPRDEPGLVGTEALRVLRLRALVVLPWCANDRGARWGLLHAHGSTCPPPASA